MLLIQKLPLDVCGINTTKLSITEIKYCSLKKLCFVVVLTTMLIWF